MVPIKTAEINRSNYGGRRTVQPQWIVMHYTANDGDSDESNTRYFQDNIVKASAHYFVDDDSITRTVPDDYVAYHCGANVYFHPSCRNYNSIGIEMCDAKRDGTVMATPATIENAAQLVAQLCRQYKIPVDHIIRHYDVTHKVCPAYWVREPRGFAAFKARVDAILEEETEMIEQSYIIVNGAKKPVRRILKDGQNFLNLRDLVKAMAGAADFDVSSQGSIPVLTQE